MAVLEAMFSDPGLAQLALRSADHPAVQRYRHLTTIVSADVSYPDEVGVLRELTSSLLDQTVWAEAPAGDDYWSFIPNAKARERIKSSILDPDQFHDAIAEVFFWSWLREHRDNAVLVEEEGLPDIVVGEGGPEEVWVEVKRLRLGKKSGQVRSVINKANRQLKTASAERAGIVVLSVERPIQRAILDNRVPSDVQVYLQQVERHLGSHVSKSVGRVVLVWEDFAVESEPGAGITYRFRRRSETRSHRTPKSLVPLDQQVTAVERSISISVGWPASAEAKRSGRGPREALGTFVVGPGFREFNAGSDGVRPQHAIEALADPDASYRYQFRHGGGEQIFATRRVTTARVAYTLLLVARPLADGRQEIGEAYRLYENTGLHRHPFAAFLEFIERYGVVFSLRTSSGSVLMRLLRAARLRVPVADPGVVVRLVGRLFELPNDISARSGAAQCRFVGDPPVAELEWLWFLNEELYRSDIRQRLR